MKKTLKNKIKDFINLNVGVALTAFCLVLILDPNDAVFGGVGGIGTIINHYVPNIPLSVIVLVINGLLLLLGFLLVGKEFCIKTLYGSIAYPVFGFIFEIILNAVGEQIFIEIFNQNSLLIVVFGSIIMGVGMGLALKAGASTGGVDIIQAVLYKHLKIPYSKSLILIDGSIVIVGTILLQNNLVQGILFVLYALVFILLSGYIMDSIVFSGFNVRATYIITKETDKVKQYIFDKLNRGVTEIHTTGGYTGEERKMLLCVLSSREYYILKDTVQTIDPNAFIYVARASEVHGEGFSFDHD